MRKILLALAALLVLTLVGAGWWLQDANRLKPSLEALLTEQAGAKVVIGGDLSWQLLPPVSLSAESVA